MTRRAPSNIAASVRQRLLNHAKERNEDFNFVLGRFAGERLLYRLSVSEHAENFILKGALLFLLWTGHLYRPTRDVDLLGFGDSSIRRLEEIVRDVCGIEAPADGLVFDADSVQGAKIRDDQEYEGVRITLLAFLEKARIPLQIDIGFGDAVTPDAEAVEFPLLLSAPALPAPKLNAYPRETVIAEKLEAMVTLGIANSRMKDFSDLLTLARSFDFQGSVLARAVRRTFERRGTLLPETTPIALTAEFSQDTTKAAQWKSFLKRAGITGANADLESVTEQLSGFLLPLLAAARRADDFQQTWAAGKSWRKKP